MACARTRLRYNNSNISNTKDNQETHQVRACLVQSTLLHGRDL